MTYINNFLREIDNTFKKKKSVKFNLNISVPEIIVYQNYAW